MKDPSNKPLLLYEAGCPFCRWAARVVARIDSARRLAILPYDDPAAARRVVFLLEDQVKSSWRLCLSDDLVLEKGDAATALLTILRPTRWIGRVFGALRLQWLAGAIDWAISRSRPLLSRIVPTDTEPVRRVD